MSDSIIVNSVGLTPEKIFGWFFEEFPLFIPFIIDYYISIIITFLTITIFCLFFAVLGFGKQKSKNAAKNLCGFTGFISSIRNIHRKH